MNTLRGMLCQSFSKKKVEKAIQLTKFAHHHATNMERKELVDGGAGAVVDWPHGLAPANPSKVKVLGVLRLEPRRAANDGGRGLGGDVVAKGRVAGLPAQADHARRHRRPLVEVRLVLNNLGVVARHVRIILLDLAFDFKLLELLFQLAKLVRVNCVNKHATRVSACACVS